MEFEWDEAKRRKVLDERGIDFLAMASLFDGRPAFSYVSRRGSETRHVTVAERNGKLCAGGWIERAGTVRSITARRARHGEETAYRELQRGGD